MTPRLSTTELKLLYLIQKERLHGHALWKKLAATDQVSRSSVYEGLQRLYRLGYATRQLEVRTKGPRRTFWRATRQGRKHSSHAWFTHREQLAAQLREVVRQYRFLLTELTRPAPSLVGEEPVPYAVRSPNAAGQAGGELPPNTADMGVNRIALGVVAEPPTSLPHLNPAEDPAGVGDQ